VAIFGRNTARQRLRRATRESLKIPAFSSPVDCTPWVTGGLWPAELSTPTAETAPLVKYLKADLQKIVNSANEQLLSIRRAGLADPVRQAEEARVINGARAFAVRRVESTVRHLRNMTPKLTAEYRPVNGADDTEKTRRFKPVAIAHPSDSDDTEVREEIATVLQGITPLAEIPVEEPPRQSVAHHAKPPVPPADDAVTTRHPAPLAESESERERLERLLKFVARQEPGLRWAIGVRADGTTLLVTDLAHGWIPPGITLPADVGLLEPDRRTGNAAALLGQTTLSASYAPSDPLGWATDYHVTDTSSQSRQLPPVDDLGWVLSEATHWRDGLPRMVNTLAKAGAAGTGILDAEIDILRVYLDTAQYQLFAQYPDVELGLLLNCLLLAATEGIATGDLVNANYHFAWFQMLSTPPASGWKAGP
jgi:Family of unknown function (DUF5631)/Family of unknown function (DUF5632)